LRKRPPAPASPRGARSASRSERLEGLIDELRGAAEAVGIRVRRERLLRDVGYQVRSGLCRLDGQEMLLLEQGLSADVQIDLLVAALSGRELESVPLSDAARRLLDAGATA
jgi:hypothetical protein